MVIGGLLVGIPMGWSRTQEKPPVNNVDGIASITCFDIDGSGPLYKCPAKIKCYHDIDEKSSAEMPCPLSKFWYPPHQ